MSKRKQPSASPPSTPRQPAKPLKVGEIALELAKAQAEGLIPRRPFAPPALPPGTAPRGARLPIASDNAMAGYSWLNTQPGMCGLGFPGYTYLSELAQRSEYRAPTETMSNEMTRQWVKFTGASESKLKQLETAFEDFGVQQAFRTVAQHDGFFGRGQLFISVKGQLSDQRRKLPLVLDDAGNGGITKGSLLGFRPIEPIWTTPYSYNSLDPTQPDFYAPQWWYILGKQTHTSRLLTFISRPVPDILKPSYNFSGMSMSQLIEPYVIRWLKTVDSVNRLISNFSIVGILTNLQASLEGDSTGSDVFKRAELFTRTRDNRGVMLLDKDSEEFFMFNVPLSGLSELQAQAQEHMAAPTHIPLVKLTGITPAGLNASAEGEIKVFYDHVASEQENQYDAPLTTVTKAIQLHLWGKVDPNIRHEWVPLDAPTDKELSEMRKADADAGVAYVSSGVLDPNEERERLRNNPNSGYTHITGDAPASPLEQEAELGEERAQKDHDRGEESAAAAHKREKELNRNKPKG